MELEAAVKDYDDSRDPGDENDVLYIDEYNDPVYDEGRLERQDRITNEMIFLIGEYLTFATKREFKAVLKEEFGI